MTRRLFTFGCSFTEYSWPTWADLISVNFDHFENWGYRGIGNRGIAERVAECHTKNKFNKNDTIIIQWSTHLRHDWYNNHELDGRPPGWKTSGSIFSILNQNVYTKEWVEMFFHEPAFIMHTLNSIILAQSLLESTGATWYMTSIGDIRNLGADLYFGNSFGESTYEQILDNDFILNRDYPEFSPYEEAIWKKNNDKWLTPLSNFMLKYRELDWWFKDENYNRWKESHPSTLQYSMWIKECLVPKMNFPQESLNLIEKISVTVEDMKEKSKLLYDFSHSLENCNFEGIDWPKKIVGF